MLRVGSARRFLCAPSLPRPSCSPRLFRLSPGADWGWTPAGGTRTRCCSQGRSPRQCPAGLAAGLVATVCSSRDVMQGGPPREGVDLGLQEGSTGAGRRGAWPGPVRWKPSGESLGNTVNTTVPLDQTPRHVAGNQRVQRGDGVGMGGWVVSPGYRNAATLPRGTDRLRECRCDRDRRANWQPLLASRRPSA